MDFDTIATDFVAQHGTGTYECSFCGVEAHVSGYAPEAAAERAMVNSLIQHARFEHVSPADILRVEHTVLLNTRAL